MEEAGTEIQGDEPIEDTGQMCTVIDTTATAGAPARNHEIMVEDGRRMVYSFKHQSPVRMPFGHAMKFRHIESFIVKNEEGGRFEPNPVLPEGSATKLGNDEVVAKLEELGQPALYARAKAMAGSDKIKQSTKKADIIKFMIRVAKKAANVDAKNSDALEGIETTGMSAAEADALVND